jgi:hypothetical protein
VFPGNATSNWWVMDLVTRFIWTFTLRSYNYLLHTLTPHKLKTIKDVIFSVLRSASRILLSNSFSHCIISPQCLLQSFLALYSFCTVSSTNLSGSVLVLVQYSTALLADKSSHRIVLPPGRRILHSLQIHNPYESSILTVLSRRRISVVLY